MIEGSTKTKGTIECHPKYSLLHFRIVFNSWPVSIRNGVKVPESLTLLVTEMLYNMTLKLLLQYEIFISLSV